MLLNLGARRIHYDLIGPEGARTVTFAHALAADSGMWAEQIPAVLGAGLRALSIDMRGRRSAMPEGAGKVVRSMMRQRSRVTFWPVLFVTVRRMSSVPKVELFAGSEVKSLTRFGGLVLPTVESRFGPANEVLR